MWGDTHIGKIVLCPVLVCASSALGAVNVSLHSLEDRAPVGHTLRVGLMAFNDAPGEVQLVSALDVVLTWDPDVFRLIGADDDGPIAWLASGFLNDPDGINDSLADGDAIYTALASPGSPAEVPDTGLLIATLLFEPLASSPSSSIDIVDALGQFGRTRVFDGQSANVNVLGSFAGTSVTTVVCGRPDADADIDTDFFDFAFFQSCFNGAGVDSSAVCLCLFDFDGDEDIDLTDYEHLFLTLDAPER